MDDKIKNEIQSATFERLLNHLDERKDVQNIDLMNLANFCRNMFLHYQDHRVVLLMHGMEF